APSFCRIVTGERKMCVAPRSAARCIATAVAWAASCSGVVSFAPRPESWLSPMTVPRLSQPSGTPFTGITRCATGVGDAVAHATSAPATRSAIAGREPWGGIEGFSGARRKLGALEVHLVDVAPAPVLASLQRLDDGVLRLVEVLRRVPVRARVAAAHVTAAEAQSQVHPASAHLQAVLAALVGVGVNRLQGC